MNMFKAKRLILCRVENKIEQTETDVVFAVKTRDTYKTRST